MIFLQMGRSNCPDGKVFQAARCSRSVASDDAGRSYQPRELIGSIWRNLEKATPRPELIKASGSPRPASG
jgi:hypothetical protein